MNYEKRILLAETKVLNLEKKIKHFENMKKLKEMEEFLKFQKHNIIERLHNSKEYILIKKEYGCKKTSRKIILKEDAIFVLKKIGEYKFLCNYYYRYKKHYSEVGFKVSKNMKVSLTGTPVQFNRNSAPVQVLSETELTFSSNFLAGMENFSLFFDGCITEIRKLKRQLKIEGKISCI